MGFDTLEFQSASSAESSHKVQPPDQRQQAQEGQERQGQGQEHGVQDHSYPLKTAGRYGPRASLSLHSGAAQGKPPTEPLPAAAAAAAQAAATPPHAAAAGADGSLELPCSVCCSRHEGDPAVEVKCSSTTFESPRSSATPFGGVGVGLDDGGRQMLWPPAEDDRGALQPPSRLSVQGAGASGLLALVRGSAETFDQELTRLGGQPQIGRVP